MMELFINMIFAGGVLACVAIFAVIVYALTGGGEEDL